MATATASFTTRIADRRSPSIPLGRRTTYGFDTVSRKTLRIDARGFRTSYAYDNDNRLTGQHYPDGTRVTFAYDKASRRTLLDDWTGRTTSIFDADGRLNAVDQSGRAAPHLRIRCSQPAQVPGRTRRRPVHVLV